MKIKIVTKSGNINYLSKNEKFYRRTRESTN